MVAGIGVDMVELTRIHRVMERQGKAFLDRILTTQEYAWKEDASLTSVRVVEYVSGRFAAKEAVAKALGTGIGKIAWTDIQILRSDSGAPVVALSGQALRISQEKRIKNWHISISHTTSNAIAYVIAES